MNNLKTTDRSIEKIKKSLKDFGNVFLIVGWFELIRSFALLMLFLFTSFSYYGFGASDFISIIIQGVILIILASRIKRNVLDKNNKLYVVIILTMYVINTMLWFILFWEPNIIIILLTIYATTTLFSLNKVLKKEKFKNMLEAPKYRIKRDGWLIFIIISCALFCAGVYIDVVVGDEELWENEDSATIINDYGKKTLGK